MSQSNSTHLNSPAWVVFVKVSFILSIVCAAIGIYFLPADLWVKGYMAMAIIYLIGNSIILSKTLRDEYEASKLINRIEEAKTERMLHGLDTDKAVNY